MALTPLEMVDLRELKVCRVGSEQTTGTLFGGRQVDLRVNVEREVSSARGPNERSNVKIFGDQIVRRARALESCGCGNLHQCKFTLQKYSC